MVQNTNVLSYRSIVTFSYWFYITQHEMDTKMFIMNKTIQDIMRGIGVF